MHDSTTNRTVPSRFRLAAIDIDDTLVGPDKLISDANRAAVTTLRRLGTEVILASGRAHDNMLPFYQSLGLDGYIVSSHGALVKHPATGDVLYERPVPGPDALRLIAEGADRGVSVLYFGRDAVYANRRDEWTHLYREDSDAREVRIANLASLPEGEPLKLIWAAPPARVNDLVAETAARYAGRLNAVVTNPYYLEFNAVGADKAAGVGAVARRYGIDAGQVMAFGDGNNDVPMLTWAGLGVAMHNGRPNAKAAADLVSPPGDPETALARAVDAVLARDTSPSEWLPQVGRVTAAARGSLVYAP